MPERIRAERLLGRLHWLERLRWLAVGGLVALTLLVQLAPGLELDWRSLLVVAAVVVAYNLIFGLVRRRLRAVGRPPPDFKRLERFANFKIALDLLALTAVLHFSGGVENPFIIIYVLHPITAAALLTPRSAYLQATFATLLLLAMGVCEGMFPVLHRPIGGFLPVPLFRDPWVIGGEVVALAAALYASVYLVSNVAERLHRRERQLREVRDALRRRSAELTRANRELRALEEKKSQFLSLAAHQLRGPLAAADGCLSTVLEGYAGDREKQMERLRRARVRIQGMLQIVRDLLTLSGTHQLSEAARVQPVSLDAVAQHVVEQYVDFAASREIDLVLQPAAGGARVLVEERALADAIGNLVSNAIKYTREGGHVKVVTRTARGEAICEVIDDGIGIPEAERERLFEEFFRASNARRTGQEGTGLGMVIVREIVTRCGGCVTVESLENLGTCAVIHLPLAEGAADQGVRRGRPGDDDVPGQD